MLHISPTNYHLPAALKKGAVQKKLSVRKKTPPVSGNVGKWVKRRRQKEQQDSQNNKRADRKVGSKDSPEIPDRARWGGHKQPGLPSGLVSSLHFT